MKLTLHQEFLCVENRIYIKYLLVIDARYYAARRTLKISYFISGKGRSSTRKALAIPIRICYSVAIGSGLAAGNLLTHG